MESGFLPFTKYSVLSISSAAYDCSAVPCNMGECLGSLEVLW